MVKSVIKSDRLDIVKYFIETYGCQYFDKSDICSLYLTTDDQINEIIKPYILESFGDILKFELYVAFYTNHYCSFIDIVSTNNLKLKDYYELLGLLLDRHLNCMQPYTIVNHNNEDSIVKYIVNHELDLDTLSFIINNDNDNWKIILYTNISTDIFDMIKKYLRENNTRQNEILSQIVDIQYWLPY